MKPILEHIAWKRLVHQSGMWVGLTYVLTTVHHVYSSFIYPPDPGISGVFAGSWRGHGFLTFLVPLALALGALYRFQASRRTMWLRLYALLNGVVFIGLIGFWEGGWNHLAKILFFHFGVEHFYAYGPGTWLQFPTVVPPQDLFFEATGVLTLVFGIINARYVLELLRLHRQEEPGYVS